MKQFYFYSIVVHLILFIWLYSTDFFGLTAPEPTKLVTKEELIEKLKADQEDQIKELVEKQIEEKERRKKEVKELIEKHKPELTEKQVDNFSDLVNSSGLDEEQINYITEHYFGNNNGNNLDELKKELGEYMQGSGTGSTGTDSTGNGGDGNVKTDITYEGSGIDHQMKEHTVENKENKELINRKLQRLRIEEAISAVDDVELIYPNLSRKPAQYAVLPEQPTEVIDTLKRTQETEFTSLSIGLAPRMNKEFVPDGILDEWDLSQPMAAKNDNLYPDFSSEIYLAWDIDEIFLAAKIKDPHPIREDSGAWWTTNSLEVWFDALNRKRHNQFDSGCFQFWFAPYPPYFGKALGRHMFFVRSLPYAVKRTSDGYIVEAVFKTDEELRYVEGLLGRTIGFHFFVNTSVRARDGYEKRLFWITDKYLPGNIHTYTWQNPNSWGDVMFTGSAAEVYLADENHTEIYNHFGINELNRVVIQDADRNLDPDTRQYVKGYLRGKISGDLEEVIFAEIEKDSWKFVGTILSENSLAQKYDGILQTQSGEPIEIIYYDQYTTDGVSRLVRKEVFTYYPIAVVK
jgi:hypothetical protein